MVFNRFGNKWLAFAAVLIVVFVLMSMSSGPHLSAGINNSPLVTDDNFASNILDSRPPACVPSQSGTSHVLPVEPAVDEWHSSRFLKGQPTLKFKDNLLDDRHYITAWSNAGLTNQFMSYVNMIYLGLLSDRIPILPPFGPDHHISARAGALPFGQIFNLSRARQSLRTPLLEWTDVKSIPDSTSTIPPPHAEREQLGCWSTRHESDPKPARVPSVVNNLRFDIAYTRFPREARSTIDNDMDDFLDFNHIVPYIFPNHPLQPPKTLPLMEKSPLGYSLSPNEKLTCFDHLYYVTSSHEVFEWRFAWSPAWRWVGTHLRFTDHLVEMAKSYLARAFKTTEDSIPPFIAVHMRRGDFAYQCHDGRPQDECLQPLAKFQKRVNQMRAEILQSQKLEVKEVILMSDEKDAKFWDDVKNIGWARLDHYEELTLEKYGEWIPPILDQVAQSMAVGFIGTEDSTFSLVAARRVQDWNKGPGVLLSRQDII